MLPLFGAIPDPRRVVRDGNVITGGGVTAGIDFALVVAAELSGEAFAQTVQLNIEYAPAPPFDSGRPETATPEELAMSRARYAKLLPGWRACARRPRGCPWDSWWLDSGSCPLAWCIWLWRRRIPARAGLVR